MQPNNTPEGVGTLVFESAQEALVLEGILRQWIQTPRATSTDVAFKIACELYLQVNKIREVSEEKEEMDPLAGSVDSFQFNTTKHKEEDEEYIDQQIKRDQFGVDFDAPNEFKKLFKDLKYD